MNAPMDDNTRMSKQYRAMIYFAVGTLHFYRGSISVKAGESVGDFMKRHPDVIRQVAAEALEYFGYELSHHQLATATYAYLCPAQTIDGTPPQSEGVRPAAIQ